MKRSKEIILGGIPKISLLGPDKVGEKQCMEKNEEKEKEGRQTYVITKAMHANCLGQKLKPYHIYAIGNSSYLLVSIRPSKVWDMLIVVMTETI